MKIIIFADVHYFAGDLETAIFNKKNKLVRYAIPLLDILSEKARDEHGADMCVNLGDIIQDTQDHDKDLEALRFMFGKLENMGVPCYSILGNHDLKMMSSTSEVEAVMGYERSTYSFDRDGYHLVFLTTEVRPELGLARGGCYKTQYLSNRDIAWLSEDLKNNELPCIIFTHFPLAEDESRDDECMFMKNRAEVKNIIKNDKNLLAVFSGHQHTTKTIVEDGVSYYLLGSLIGSNEMNGIPDGVYFEVDLIDGTIEVKEHHLETPEITF